MTNMWLLRRTLWRERNSHAAVFLVLALVSAIFAGIFGIVQTALAESADIMVLQMFITLTLIGSVLVLWTQWGVSVSLRQRHFQTMRMMGLARRDVIGTVVSETVIIGLAAGVVGAVLAPITHAFFYWLFDSVGLKDMPTTTPAWFLVGMTAAVVTVSLAVLSGVNGAVTVIKGKALERTPKPFTVFTRIIVWAACALGATIAAHIVWQSLTVGKHTGLDGLFRMVAAGILLAPGIYIAVTHFLRSALNWRVGRNPMISATIGLTGSGELTRRQMTPLLGYSFAFTLCIVFLSFFQTAQDNSRIAVEKMVTSGHVLMDSSENDRGLNLAQYREFCEQNSGACERTVMRGRVDGKFASYATPTTWNAIMQPAEFFPKIPQKVGEVTQEDPDSGLIMPFSTMVAVDKVVPTERTVFAVFVDSPDGLLLPANVRAMEVHEWAREGGTALLMSSASPWQTIALLLTILILTVAFGVTTSILRHHAGRSESLALQRNGFSMLNIRFLNVLRNLVPVLALGITSLSVAAMSSWTSFRHAKLAGLSDATMHMPWLLIVGVFGGLIAAVCLPPLVMKRS